MIAVSSTLAQYIGSVPLFSMLHTFDNKDLYLDRDSSFKWKAFIRDMGKMQVGLATLDYAYCIGRSILNHYLQKNGYDPASSSFLADMICIPAYWLASIPLARRLNIIREDKDLTI